MKPQELIEQQLNKLKEIDRNISFEKNNLTEEDILKLLLAKKFRKYSASEDLISHCRQAINLKMAKKEPINVTFLHGAYKLWRLEESPCADWAEFFALMYYTNWVKNICGVYEPGVCFDFFVDDLIIPRLNNFSMNDVETYLESYKSLIEFLKPYQPKNLKMTITTVGSQFESREKFEEMLEQNLLKLKTEEFQQLTESQRAMVELNVKKTHEQELDPKWAEKVWQLHNVYSATKRMANYHYSRPDKILAFTQPLPSGSTISVGTTKSSVAKFWAGVGVLKQKNDSFQEIILSPSQLKMTDFDWENINIPGLSGKNFSKIRIIR